MGNGAPRMDPYLRLIARFFEVLLLLSVLKRVQGPHLTVNHDASSLSSTRRRFLQNLSFLCDYKKGGDSTSAVAIEDTPEFYRFLITSNEGPKDSVVSFLGHVLDSITSIIRDASELRDEALEELTRYCCSFSEQRMKKEVKLLARTTKKCLDYLSEMPYQDGMCYGLNNRNTRRC